jgi:N4-gp56 family major capsid protein
MAARISKAQQQKIYNAALFALTQKQFSFINMLTGKSPKGTSDINKKQTDAGAPIVRVEDLSKAKGDEVSLDIVHDINKEPTMGDDRIEGRGDSMTFATDTIKIDQTRHMVDSGGKMLQQTTGIALPPVATKMLQGYYKRLEEERMVYHAAGARGDLYTKGMIVPPSDAKNFGRIMVNELTAPTKNRKFYGGDATGIADLDGSDLFSLSVVDDIWLSISEMDNPLQHLRMDGDMAADDNPFYVMFVTPRQWNDFYTSTSGKEWQQMIANAHKRSTSFNHQVFKGDCLMYRNILVKPFNRYVQFNAGSTVMEANADGSETAQNAGTTIHRSILLGGQALAQAWGNAGKKTGGKSHFTSTTKDVDHDNAKEHSIAWMNGTKKLRFEDRDGYVEDHGIIAVDTAVS